MSNDLRLTGGTSSDRRIDKICDAYESDWFKGKRPNINDFLEHSDEAIRAELFYELLLVELEFRRNQGDRPTSQEYLRDFPQFAEQIEAADFHSGGTAFVTTTGADDVTLPNHDYQPGSRIEHFELVERLGAGSMGDVWKAQDTRLRRFVAIKLPRAEALTEADLRRFLREGQAAAQLRHPRLAAVHQVGRKGKTVFIVADYVEGENLKTYLASHPLSYAEMADLCAEVAEALHYAHEQEIVHRDLKPANIIVDRAGKPHVIDFGLAKWSNEDRDLTLQGVVLGTPAYMSPEQANGDAAKQDRRTDVYSLGVILYEMLVGRCPFVGDQGSIDHQILPELLRRIAFDEPQRLRRINRRIPIDLETIVTKAMEKCVADRYSSALEFANDLRRYLATEPIKAKRASHAERMVKWSRRHPTLVTSFGLAFVLLIAILLASIVMINRARIDTLDALEATSELLYVSDMSAAFDAWDERYSDEVQAILDQHRPTAGTPDRRGFEWHLLDRVARQPEPIVLAGHLGSVTEISVFPDRRRLASVGEDSTLRIWDVATQKSTTITLGHEGLRSVAVSPDGRRVAAGSKTIYLCDLGEAISAREVLQRDYTVESLAFSPDGKKLAAGVRYDELCLLSLEGNVIKSVPCASRVESLEFMPKQPFLLVPNRRAVKYDSRHGIAQLWRDDLSAVEREFDSSYAWRRAETTLARSSPDGRFIAGGGLYQSRVRLFDSATGRVVAESQVARDLLTALAYSPDGKAIAAGYQNGVVECFELRGLDDKPSISARPRVINAHQGIVEGLCFVDHNNLATSGKDGLIKVWDLRYVARRQFNFAKTSLRDVALSPDGALLGCAYVDKFIIAKLKGKVVANFRLRSPRSVAWSPSSDRVAVCSDSFEVSMFDRRGNRLFDIPHPDLPEQVAFSSDGRFVAVISQTQLKICDVSNGMEVDSCRLPTKEGGLTVAYSHNGQYLACGDRYGVIFLRDRNNNFNSQTLKCDSTPNTVAFSPDDSLIASGHADGVIRLWDVKSGQLKFKLVGHGRSVSEIAFVPDGRTLLSASSDGTVRVWSTDHNRIFGIFHRVFETGVELGRDVLCRLSISSDGRRLVVGFNSLTGRPKIFLWDIDYSQ